VAAAAAAPPRQRGLRRRVIRLPLITPRASRLFLGLLTPVYGRIAGAMVESLRNETVVRSDAALAAFAIRPRGLTEAIERALVNEDLEFAETRWSDAMPEAPSARWGGVAFRQRMVTSRVVQVSCKPTEAFAPVQRIGGPTGWYAMNWFWRLRGLADTIGGGVGLRRGRRDPHHLRVGDAVDFWRVERIEPGRVVLDGETVSADLLLVVPPHRPPAPVQQARSSSTSSMSSSGATFAIEP